MAHCLLGERVQEIRVLLDQSGSFAGTFGQMYEDQAMLAGAMGCQPDDPLIFTAARAARSAGIRYTFDFGELKESTHINAMKFVLTGQSGRVVTLVGDSTGGGMIQTRLVNGYPLTLIGDCYALLAYDPLEIVPSAEVEREAFRLPGFLRMEIAQEPGAGRVYCIQTSLEPDMAVTRRAFPGLAFDLLRPVLPVLASDRRKPQLFQSMAEWRRVAEERGQPLWEAAVQYEMDASGWSHERVILEMQVIAGKMHRQTHAAYEPGQIVPESPFKQNLAALWEVRHRSADRLTDDLTANMMRLIFGAGAGIPRCRNYSWPDGQWRRLYLCSALCGKGSEGLQRRRHAARLVCGCGHRSDCLHPHCADRRDHRVHGRVRYVWGDGSGRRSRNGGWRPRSSGECSVAGAAGRHRVAV